MNISDNKQRSNATLMADCSVDAASKPSNTLKKPNGLMKHTSCAKARDGI